MTPRHQIPALLAQLFSRSYSEMLKSYELDQQIELTEHLLQQIKIIKEYQKTQSEKIFSEYTEKETNLLKKYGKHLKPYSEQSFYKFFRFDIAIMEADFYTSKEYNELPYEQQNLSDEEIEHILQLYSNTLANSLHIHLYLQKEPEFELSQSKEIKGTEIDKDITEARQLLAIYYLLKTGFRIEHRENKNVSEIARFAHLMTGEKFTTLQKSNIYKKYQLIPNYNKGEYLIKDLQYIKPYFQELGLTKAVEEIDLEIQATIKDLPRIKRKKFE